MRSPGRLQVKKCQDITGLYNFLHNMWSILSPKYTHPLGAGMHWVRDNATQNGWIHSFLQPLKPKWSMDGGLVRAHEATLAEASPPHHSQILSWTWGQSRNKQFPHFAYHTLRQNTHEEKSKHPFCGLPLDWTDYKETEQATAWLFNNGLQAFPHSPSTCASALSGSTAHLPPLFGAYRPGT